MRTMEFDNIAASVAANFKKRFPKLEYCDLLQEARIIVLKADVDENRDKGEIAQYLKNLVTWRLRDDLRKTQGLRCNEENRVKTVLFSTSKKNDTINGLEARDFNYYRSSTRRQSFLDDVSIRINQALLKSREHQLLYGWIFIDGLSEMEIATKTGVALRIVCKKRQVLLDILREKLHGLKV